MPIHLKSYSRWLQPVAWRYLAMAFAVSTPLWLILSGVPGAAGATLHWLTWVGVGFQLFGFYLVWRRISAALREHGRPSTWQRMRAWWRRRPGQPAVVHAAAAIATAGVSVSAHARQRANAKNLSSTARLDAIEANLRHIENELDGVRQEQKRSARDLESKLTQEQATREAKVRSLSERIESQAVGNSDQQVLGLCFFVVGTVYAAIPGDIVRWLG